MESENRTDRMLHANVEAFEAALKAGRERVTEPEWPERVLGVLDGSNQDLTTIALLAAIQERCAGTALLTAGVLPEHDEEDVLTDALRAVADGVTIEGVLTEQAETHDRVLAIVGKKNAELCVVPSPFGHDLDELEGTTLGTVVEVCLARAGVPVLVVRGPLDDAVALLERPHVLIPDIDASSARATRLGLGLLAAGGQLRGTLAISFLYAGEPDADVDAAVAKGYELDADELMPLLSDGRSSFLHRLDVLAEETADLALETRLIHPGGRLIDEGTETNRLHVLPMRHEEHGVSELVHDFVLSTLDPVLVVPAVSAASA